MARAQHGPLDGELAERQRSDGKKGGARAGQAGVGGQRRKGGISSCQGSAVSAWEEKRRLGAAEEDENVELRLGLLNFEGGPVGVRLGFFAS